MHCSTNNHVSLLLNGDNTFSAIFSAIQQAQKVILIQFYIVRDDKIGQELSCLLQKKAAEGVKIYFLYDAIGSHKLPENYIQYLRNADIQIFSFPAGRSILNKFQLNFRNHRKVVVIDGHTGFIGGHNVGDEYLGRKPPLAPWRDTHIKITGPVVTCLQESFAQDWFWSTKELPDMLPLTKCPKQEMLCQLITTGPADTEEAATLLLLDAASQAEHRLWISTPYFVIDDTVFSALKLAALRGIDVRILLPQKSDSWVVHAASMLYAFEALHSKIRVFRYQPGFIHQKIILIDEAIAVIGSANLDNRSIHLNFEIMLLTVDIQFAAEVSDMLEKDFKQANELSITDQKHIRRWQNLGMRIARLVSPIL
ncbi:UNVERIFIED_CONTAM: hypothetical protein GTU68_035401 [Idotea baltica]|nr:hypothetical protein [Idotea baltica]